MEPGLRHDWVTAPALDAELKRYLLLGYLQRLQEQFDARKLYPWIEELCARAHELRELDRDRSQWEERLHGPLIGLDPRTGRAVYERPVLTEWMATVDLVIGYSLPHLTAAASRAQELQQEIRSGLRLETVGLLPLEVREGYLLLREEGEARVYSYVMPLLHNASEVPSFGAVRTTYLTRFKLSLACHYHHIKAELVRTCPQWPNPATFVLESASALPRLETLLPLARRLVYRTIEQGVPT